MEKMTHRTMEEFAQSCGISRPTLSRYFDDPSSVRPTTRKRIEAALRSSSYEPNLFARNLNRKRTRHVGILVPTTTDPFYAEVVSLIELRLRDEGYLPIVFSSHGSHELEAEAVRTMLSLKVAGVIAAPLGMTSDHRVFEKLRKNIPVVYFDTYIEGDTPFVGTNNRQSVSTMVDYLSRSGDAPAYFDMPHVNHNAEERLDGYIFAMEALGLEPIVLGNSKNHTWDFERIGFEQMEKMLETGPLPCRTILCANDRLAFGVIAAAFSCGKMVGRKNDSHLRVAAHDDHPLSRYTCPPLTTMAQNFTSLAGNSVDMLLPLLQEDGALATTSQTGQSRVGLDGTLIMRQSA
ncbi:LacI family transcriptional regulator [Phyllobacterium myrsinacearum]|uniref:LacI family DNA-binding transcriptional regulator n=1 Tax=Phyllobacterium myrsinacearum TaxID=28101 RepID=UPI00102A8564|nr:LacI family DNA-binding transcriptional regulator [Phyllobacterium myrsinacearum]RZS88103.1 LacI family transcriptional regulator [Phyllobacterium myrsinacearum]